MLAETTVYNALSASSALSAFVSTRIYMEEIEQMSKFPCVVYGRIGTEGHGSLTGDNGSATVQISVEIHSDKSYDECRDIATAIRSALADIGQFRGQVTDSEPEREIFILVLEYTVYEEVAL